MTSSRSETWRGVDTEAAFCPSPIRIWEMQQVCYSEAHSPADIRREDIGSNRFTTAFAS